MIILFGKDKEDILDKLVSRFSKEDLYSELAKKLANKYYFYHSNDRREIEERVGNRVVSILINEFIQKQKESVLESMSELDFSELVREGIKDHYKSLMSDKESKNEK